MSHVKIPATVNDEIVDAFVLVYPKLEKLMEQRLTRVGWKLGANAYDTMFSEIVEVIRQHVMPINDTPEGIQANLKHSLEAFKEVGANPEAIQELADHYTRVFNAYNKKEGK